MTVEKRLEAVRARIRDACLAAEREPDAVRLIAVSKRHSVAAIREAYAAGQRDFGENYVQELVEKAAELGELDDLRWHFIGHLQRNKVKAVLRTRAVISTLDSARLLDAIDSRASESTPADVLIQVNVGADANKSGCGPTDLRELAAQVRAAGNVRLAGLMTILPVLDDPSETRALYAALRRLGGEQKIAELSMGMSADLELAVAEGATSVRVGTAIFGPRPS